MFEPENGDRPKKPNYNTFVTDGISTSGTAATEADIPSSADRVIVVALGPNSEPTLKDLTTYPGDFLDASFSCNVKEFLKQRLLCEDNKLTVAPNANCTRIIVRSGAEAGTNSTVITL